MNGQEELCKAFETIRKMATVTGKKDKETILKQGSSEYLKILLKLAYNKFITFRIQQIEQPSAYNSVQPDTLKEFEILASKLASHSVGSNEAKALVKAFLAKNSVEGADIFTRVLLRDLKMGAEISTINKCFPGLIPEFKVQLANKAEDLSALNYNLLAEIKYDGVRAIAVYDGENVKFFSREGREFDECGVIAAQIAQLAPGLPMVYDGEFIAKAFNPENKTCKKLGEAGNWKFHYGLSMLKTADKEKTEVEQFLSYVVWDCLDYEYFLSSGVCGVCKALEARKIMLSGLFSRHGLTFKNLFEVPNWVCSNPQEVLSLFREHRNNNEEGIMLKNLSAKYDFKRSNAVLKLKEMESADLYITNCFPGEGKYQDMLGALEVSSADGSIKSKVGSGFTDEDRSVMYLDFLEGRLLGLVAEVTYQEKTKDGSLRFPVFQQIRWDKTVAD